MADKENGEQQSEKDPCLRCALVASLLNRDGDPVQCGAVAHELAYRLDSDRVAELPRRLDELVATFHRGDGEWWAEKSRRFTAALESIAARRREREDDLTRKHGR